MTSIILIVALAHTARAISYNPGSIPLNWTTTYACAVDVPSRVISGVVTTVEPDNTVATCIERCDAQNFIYAGVENGNECHCGTGLVGTPQTAPTSDCSFACSGEVDLTCGGAFRIQIYKSPALTSGGWGYDGCLVDTPAQPAFAAPVVHHTFPTGSDMLFDNCLTYCGHIGLPFSGTENATECQCSAGIAPGAVSVDRSECALPCAGPFGLVEQCGGVERVLVFRNE